MELLDRYFWLLCGLWVGVAGGMSYRYMGSKAALPPELSIADVNRFAKGWATAIVVPCLLLWLLQWTVGPASHPQFTAWPSPQKWIAVGVTIISWLTLLYWVWFASGALRLSQMASLYQSSTPQYLRGPSAFKVLSLIIVASGGWSLGTVFLTR